MHLSGTLNLHHFTRFFRAAEGAAASAEVASSNEGCPTLAMSGYIVQTPHAAEPYKVIFDHGDGPDTEQACGTILECRALIKRSTSIPVYRSTFPDQEPCAL
jgi:hypothetical protein